MIRKKITICGKEYRSISEASRELNISYTVARARIASADFPDWESEHIKKNRPVVSTKFENWVKRDKGWIKV